MTGQPVRWYVYLTAPVARLAAVIDLAPAVVDTPQRIADIAEQARAGNGASVLEYVQDLPEAFAIPVERAGPQPGQFPRRLMDDPGSDERSRSCRPIGPRPGRAASMRQGDLDLPDRSTRAER
ncbi:hypothetical protein [Micromonospora aurantiaca (nom. illeg.)]|uniref:hypothetical protein n=1 Tax=Micromonospora aurantiaca (nom. illeg.) TaxID=47850 RepID=UPI0033ED506F